MAEYRLQETNYPSTFAYHEHRERAPHLEQSWHAGRIYMAVKLLRSVNPASVVDLGCGDGGLLSLIKDIPSWGYDFCPANSVGWTERGVEGHFADVFNTEFEPKWAECVVTTEVLEHLDDPHGVVAWIASKPAVKYIVASSPFDETPGGICDSHLWGWDDEGYKALIGEHFNIITYRRADTYQLILAGRE